MGEGEKQTLIHRVRFWWMSRAYLLFLFAGLCAAQDKTIVCKMRLYSLYSLFSFLELTCGCSNRASAV